MKTIVTPNSENEAIAIGDYRVELLLKRLNERLQIAAELMPQDCTDIYSTAYFRGCQTAYRTAIEDIRLHLIEEPEPIPSEELSTPKIDTL